MRILIEKVFHENDWPDVGLEYVEAERGRMYFPEDKADFNGFRTSINLALCLGLRFPWCDATKWFPIFREAAPSPSAWFTDMSDVIRYFNRHDKLFVRPTSPYKTFAGDVYTKYKFINELEYLKQQNGDIYQLCLVAKPVEILREFRCVFVNREFVSMSQYMQYGQKNVIESYDSSIRQFAESIAVHPYFDNIFNFVIDCGWNINGDLIFIEPNAFETSSFYAADLELIYTKYKESL